MKRLFLLAVALLTLCPAVPRAAQPIDIEKWPDDVPCDKLKRHPDSTYEMTVPWRSFFTVHAGGKWRNTRETRYWDAKCKGKTQ